MKLIELLNDVKTILVEGDVEMEVKGVEIDSRQVKDDYLFVAIRGTQADGHQYIGKAIAQGATAVVCQQLPEDLPAGVTFIRIEDTEDATGKIATQFYGNPSTQLKLVGVTGTNGKTTIANIYGVWK